jgi:hypothetical protein
VYYGGNYITAFETLRRTLDYCMTEITHFPPQDKESVYEIRKLVGEEEEIVMWNEWDCLNE